MDMYGFDSELPALPEVFIPPPATEEAFSHLDPVHQSVDFPVLEIEQVQSYPTVPIQHPILLPDQQSTYSELSANLAYMSSLSITPPNENAPEDIQNERKKRIISKIKERRYRESLEVADPVQAALLSEIDWEAGKIARQQIVPAAGKSSTDEKSPVASRGRSGSSLALRQGSTKTLPPKRIPPPYGVGRSGGTSSRGSSAGKKLGLACLFCRERKIACGRPSESNPDQTCK